MKSTIVKLESKEVTISQLPLGKFADLIRAIKQLPLRFNELSGLPNDEIMIRVPGIVADCLPETMDILGIATDLTKEEISNLSLDEVITLVLAVVEINNFKGIYERLKKAFAQPTKLETKK